MKLTFKQAEYLIEDKFIQELIENKKAQSILRIIGLSLFFAFLFFGSFAV